MRHCHDKKNWNVQALLKYETVAMADVILQITNR